MARTPAQRGRIGTWLVQSRLARGYETQAEARREIERLTGWRIPQSQYAEWESGRRVPSEPALERLQGFYGRHEETAPALGEGGWAQVVEALNAQTQAIVAAIQGRDAVLSGLLSELGQFRKSQLQVLRSMTATRAVPMPGGGGERPLPGDPATRAVRR